MRRNSVRDETVRDDTVRDDTVRGDTVRGTAAQRGRTLSGAAALTTLVLCLGSATPALAASKAHGKHPKPAKDPLASVRKKALADVTVYGKRLNIVLRTGAGSQALTADELLALHDAGVLEGVAVRDDRVAVVRATSRAAIVAAVSSAQRTVAVASLQLLVSTQAEAHLSAAAPLTESATTLSEEATTAAASGSDTTDLTNALDALSIDLESAQRDEATAIDDALGLSANASAADLKAAAAAAGDDLGLVDQDVSDATDDLATAQAAYDNLGSGSTGDGSGDGSVAPPGF